MSHRRAIWILAMILIALPLVALVGVVVANKPKTAYGFLRNEPPISYYSGLDGSIQYYCELEQPEAVAERAESELAPLGFKERATGRIFRFEKPGVEVLICLHGVMSMDSPKQGRLPEVRLASAPQGDTRSTAILVLSDKKNSAEAFAHIFWKAACRW